MKSGSRLLPPDQSRNDHGIATKDTMSNMAVPTFDMTLAVHMSVNATWLKVPHREGTGWVGAAEELRFALTLVSSAQRVRQGKAPPDSGRFCSGRNGGEETLA